MNPTHLLPAVLVSLFSALAEQKLVRKLNPKGQNPSALNP